MFCRNLIIILLVALSAAWSGCRQPAADQAQLYGAWKTDSIFRYYNGFTQHIPDGSGRATYQYLESGKVREQKAGDYREFLYEWKGADSLLFSLPEGPQIGAFQVLRLTQDQLVLKKQMEAIFEGPGQERYEIRYFSRMQPQP